MKAWYFSGSDKKLRYGDNREIAIGVTHAVDGEPVVCGSGLHGSKRITDAVRYSPGPVVWQVELGGRIVSDDGTKHVAQTRTYLSGGIDITDILRAHARWCALQVAHLWDCPAIVREWLEKGDGNKRQAAAAAANAAAEKNADAYAYTVIASYANDVVSYAAAAAAEAADAADYNCYEANYAAASYASYAASYACYADSYASHADAAAAVKAKEDMQVKQERHLLKLVRAAIAKGGE